MIVSPRSSISPVSGLVELRELSLRDNRVTSVEALRRLLELTTAYTRGNDIKDFTPVEGRSENLDATLRQ